MRALFSVNRKIFLKYLAPGHNFSLTIKMQRYQTRNWALGAGARCHKAYFDRGGTAPCIPLQMEKKVSSVLSLMVHNG